jgi:hypothetical protein
MVGRLEADGASDAVLTVLARLSPTIISRSTVTLSCDDCYLAESLAPYSGFHISIWQHRTHKRSPGFYSVLTPILPEGAGEYCAKFAHL